MNDTPTSARAADETILLGDVFWIAPDTEADASGIVHPHVVVQADVFNRSRVATIIACAITSNLKRQTEPGNVLLDPGEGGLPRQSVVIVSQIDSHSRAKLTNRIGSLSQARVEQILAGLQMQQRSFFGPSGAR